LEDPRIERKKLHNLMDIIILVICGTGAEGWEKEFGNERMVKLGHFKNGNPSHYISYV